METVPWFTEGLRPLLGRGMATPQGEEIYEGEYEGVDGIYSVNATGLLQRRPKHTAAVRELRLTDTGQVESKLTVTKPAPYPFLPGPLIQVEGDGKAGLMWTHVVGVYTLRAGDHSEARDIWRSPEGITASVDPTGTLIRLSDRRMPLANAVGKAVIYRRERYSVVGGKVHIDPM